MENSTRMKIPAVILCILFIMLSSVFFRLLFHHQSMSLGDDYLDNETNLPYLNEMDCYYQLRMTKDIALYGHPGDTMKNGVPWDSLSYAPEGRDTSTYRPFLAYIAIAANRVISVFTPQSLDQTVYWLSIFLSVLVVIPVFLLAFEMCGLTGAIAASVLAVLNLGYLYNTLPGFYDTDCVISWVACFFFYCGVKLVKGWQKTDKKTLILSGIGLIVSFIALYKSWYVYYIFPGFFAGALVLFQLLTLKKGNKKSLLSFAPLLLAAGIIIAIFVLEKELLTKVKFYFDQIFSKPQSGSGGSLFQNVFASISELQKPALWTGSFSDLFLNAYSETNLSIINRSGGIIPFLSASVMCVILIIRIIRKDVRVEYLLLLIWFAATLVLSFNGQRFIILFAVPSAILAGNLVGTVCGVMNQRKLKLRSVYKCLMLILLLFPALYGVYSLYGYVSTVSAEGAQLVGAMEESLLKVREKTPEDTVLATWWDYGYFLQEKGDRRTLFDGGTQNRERAFLVARAFATQDEDLSANIFRMLSGSGNKGCDLMLSTFGETDETLLFMDELLSGGKTAAREKLLTKDISEDLANEITELLFPQNLPLTECVITPDMPWICGWFSTLGLTSTEKEGKFVYFAWDVLMMPIDLPESGRTAVDTGCGYYVILERRDGGYYACTSTTEEPSDEQVYYIERVIVMDQNGYTEYPQSNDMPANDPNTATTRESIPWTVVVFDDGEDIALSTVSSSLVDSVFGGLVFFDGEGLTRYKLEPELSSGVLVYRIME